MSKDEYLITDPPLKALTVFAMPMILGSFFQQVYNMADSIIVGQFVGSSALAAVGACAALTNVFICVALGAGVVFVSIAPIFVRPRLTSSVRRSKRSSRNSQPTSASKPVAVR